MSKRKADDLIEREISKDSGKTEYLLKNGQHRIAYGKEERDNSSEVCKTGERSELESYITIKQISKATGEETGSGSTVTTDSNNYILITVDLSNNTNIRYDRAVAAILRLYMVTWSGALRIGIYKAVPTIGACYTKGDKIDTFADDTVLHGDSIVRCNIINDFVSDHIAVRQYLLDIDDHTTNWTCYNNTQLCYRPTLTVDYIPYLEIRKRQSYIEGNVGAGGHFAVNALTGKIDFTRTLFSLNGNKMPISLKLCYNCEESANGNLSPFNQPGMPYGFRFNYAQVVVADGNNYIYIDANYKKHTFEPTATSGYFVDTLGTGLVLQTTASGYTITDESINIIVFDTNGRLTEIRRQTDVSTFISTYVNYDNIGKLTSIVDGAGRTTSFTYTTSSVTITKPDEKTIVINHTNNILSSIVGEDGQTSVTTFTFSNDGYLTTVVAPLGEKITVSYNTSKWVTSVTETVENNSDAIFVKRHSLIYKSYGTLYAKKENLDSDDRKSLMFDYIFDDYGQTCNVCEYLDEDNQVGDLKTGRVILRNYTDYARYMCISSDPAVSSITFTTGHDYVELHCDVPVDDEFDTYDVCGSVEIDGTNLIRGKNYYLVGTVEIISGTTNVSNWYHYLYLSNINWYLGTRIAVANASTACIGKQIIMTKFTYTGVSNSLHSGLYAYALIEVPDATVKFSDVKIIAETAVSETDCITISNNSQPIYTDFYDKNWFAFETMPLYLNGQYSRQVKLTKADILKNKANETIQGASYNFWYNDLKNVIINAALPTLRKNNLNYGINDFDVATVSFDEKQADITEYKYNGTYFCQEKHIRERYPVAGNNERVINSVYYDEYFRKVKETDINLEDKIYEYDQYGNLIEQKTYDEVDVFSLINNEYSTNGDYLVKTTDYLETQSNETTYQHNSLTGNLTSQISTGGVQTQYSYATNNIDLASLSAQVPQNNNTTLTNQNSLVYNKGRLESLTHNGFIYSFTYDGRNRLETVKIGSTTLITKSYDHYYNRDEITITYANGYEIKECYDVYGRLVCTYRKTNGSFVPEKKYFYAEQENVDSITDPLSSDLIRNAGSKLRKTVESAGTTKFVYNIKDNKTDITEHQSNYVSKALSIEKDKYDRIATRKFYFGDIDSWDKMQTDFAYRENDIVSASTIAYASFEWESNTSDDMKGKRFSEYSRLGGSYVSANYTYYSRKNALGQVTGTTDYLKKIDYSLKKCSVTQPISLGSDVFEYDGRGNVTKVTSGSYVTQYHYDGLNRLTREDNQKLNKTFVFAYDAGGNIITKTEYTYTTGTPINAVKVYNYVYDNVWKDKMTSFDNKSCVYDAAGNPTTYIGKTLTWTKWRRLSTIQTNHHGTVSFDYDADGKIKSKYIPSDYTDVMFVWDDDRIVRTRSLYDDGDYYEDTYIEYIYSHSGPIGLRIDGTPYFYKKNVFGDIVAIYDAAGNLQCNYAYDAWGNCKITNASGAQINYGVGYLNALRYRGYYWDEETCLYFLRTRFYDPETGRFINADDVSYLDPQVLNGLNLFAYCNNNPVMNTDPDGTFNWCNFFRTVLDLAITVAAVATGIAVAGVVATGALAATGSALVAGTAAAVAGIATTGAINNAVNAIYYNHISDGTSDLTPTSYSGDDGNDWIYINRFDRLDYTKQNSCEETYNLNAMRYYGEYSFHMYMWGIFKPFYIDDTYAGEISPRGFAASARVASVGKELEKGGKYSNLRNTLYIIFGILGG